MGLIELKAKRSRITMLNTLAPSIAKINHKRNQQYTGKRNIVPKMANRGGARVERSPGGLDAASSPLENEI